jgi:hypothetical protein
LVDLDVEAGRDDTRFVQSAIELYDDLARAMVVYYLEFANVACQGVNGMSANSVLM